MPNLGNQEAATRRSIPIRQWDWAKECTKLCLLMEQAQSKSKTGRLIWLDVIKGLSIIMVIYAHLLTKDNLSVINSLYQVARMPVFFCISGFFMYNISYDLQLLWKRMRKRLRVQLMPTIIFFFLFVFAFRNSDFEEYIFDTYKSGYWFTYVSVLYFFTLAPLLVLFSRFRIGDVGRIVVFLSIMVVSVVSLSLANSTGFLDTKLGGLLSFEHYIGYLRFLAVGCIFRILWNKYADKLMRWQAFTVAIVVFAVSYIFGGLLSLTTSFAGIYILLYSSYILSSFFAGSKVVDFLAFLGSLTLEIYLLHYFVVEMILLSVNGYSGLISNIVNKPWEFFIIFVMSLAVALICLLIVKSLDFIKLKKLIFGK